jgi:membrane-bound lytic murein transglycosylase A
VNTPIAARRANLLAPLFTLAMVLAACGSEPLRKDYGRALPPGAPALIPLGPGEPRPDVRAEWAAKDKLLPALDHSLEFLRKSSATRYFPMAGISHDRTLASLERFRELLESSPDEESFARSIDSEFQVYKSAGWDGAGGGVLFTGYCTPILEGSLERSAEFSYPLYALPPDLEKDKEGTVLGQRTSSGLQPYPDRRTIESSHMLDGQGLELAWLRTPLDAFLAHVNGSAVIRLPGRTLHRLGYAGNNGHEYTSLRAELVKDGKLQEAKANLTSIRRWAADHPDEVPGYLGRNERFVFFTPIEGNPRGSLNVEVTAERSLATDKTLFPRGALVYVDTHLHYGGGISSKNFHRFMFDQDTGGAIRTAGRADMYLGIGPGAERLAGATAEEGQLYYYFLKR